MSAENTRNLPEASVSSEASTVGDSAVSREETLAPVTASVASSAPFPARRLGAIGTNIAGFDAAIRKCFEELMEINGQDSYSTAAIALGKVPRETTLALPKSWVRPTVSAELVGSEEIAVSFSLADIAQLYALNLTRCSSQVASVRLAQAILRVEAIKAGYVDVQNQQEIIFLPDLPESEALNILGADIAEINSKVQTAKIAGYIVPIVAEHVFRTTGHHFLTGDAPGYMSRYQRTLNSCLTGEVAIYMEPGHLFHEALHWVTPRRSRQVLAAQLTSKLMPDAMKIRYDAAPAGTAIVTTTMAVLNAMDGVSLKTAFALKGHFDFSKIDEVCKRIRLNPVKYHKSAFAYGQAYVTGEELAHFESAKEVAVKFAPIAQAFISTYLKDSAMNEAKALKKYAADNPVMEKRAEKLFREIGRKDVVSIESLFTDSIERVTT